MGGYIYLAVFICRCNDSSKVPAKNLNNKSPRHSQLCVLQPLFMLVSRQRIAMPRGFPFVRGGAELWSEKWPVLLYIFHVAEFPLKLAKRWHETTKSGWHVTVQKEPKHLVGRLKIRKHTAFPALEVHRIYGRSDHLDKDLLGPSRWKRTVGDLQHFRPTDAGHPSCFDAFRQWHFEMLSNNTSISGAGLKSANSQKFPYL